MSFTCNNLSITDDPDFGCTIKFSDTKDPGNIDYLLVDEINNSNEKYFLLQRSYPEEQYENNFYSIESSESKTELGYKDLILIDLSRYSVKFQWSGDKIEIELILNENDFVHLKKILRKRFKDRIIMTEN